MLDHQALNDQQPRHKKILDFHNSLLDRSRASEEQLWELAGWSSPSSQLLRFERLLRTTSFSGGSVLDWGCGGGDLFAYLSKTGHRFNYTGYDINPRMIALAQRRFGSHFDLVSLSHQVTAEYDYIFASGIFQFRDDARPTYFLDYLESMFRCARRAVAVNFLSALRNSENKIDDELYVEPTSIVPFLSRICNRWVIDHSYHPGKGDFTVALLKSDEDDGWRRPDFSEQRTL